METKILTDKEQKRREYIRQWREKNKDRLKQKRREDYEKNKERDKARMREYYQENKEKMDEYTKQYYNDHKKELNRKRSDQQRRRYASDPEYRESKKVLSRLLS